MNEDSLDARVTSSSPLTQAWPLLYLLYGEAYTVSTTLSLLYQQHNIFMISNAITKYLNNYYIFTGKNAMFSDCNALYNFW